MAEDLKVNLMSSLWIGIFQVCMNYYKEVVYIHLINFIFK